MTTTSPPARIRVASAIDPDVASHARRLLAGALPAELQDDRFDAWPPSDARWHTPPGFVAALATAEGGVPIGYLGGAPERGRLRLDCLVAPGLADPAAVLGQLYDAVLSAAGTTSSSTLEIWGRPAERWHHQLAAKRDLVEVRALHQMRCHLPVEVEPLATRPYEAHDDLDVLLAVNNRAFADHPDQGGLSRDDLLATMGEPWFEAGGLRLHEREGHLAGFCWTKIHRRPTGDLGEIYVIGVDPDFHGRGLGVPMTAAGLQWLSARGLQIGMLYVEAGNLPAIVTYERLGFSVVRTDRAWAAPLPPSP